MNRDDALKKIKKCLALGRSANEHEAGIALGQAQKLMAQFGLADEDVSLSDVYEVKVKARSVAANAWELRLVGMVADAFGCEQFGQLSARYTPVGAYVRERHWVFVGLGPAAQVAGYACEVLSRQCSRARAAPIAKQPKNCKPITKTSRGDLFASGWVTAVRSKVETFARPQKDKTLLRAYIAREHGELQQGKVRNTTTGRKLDAGHLTAGWSAGAAAQLNHAVSGGRTQERLV